MVSAGGGGGADCAGSFPMCPCSLGEGGAGLWELQESISIWESEVPGAGVGELLGEVQEFLHPLDSFFK